VNVEDLDLDNKLVRVCSKGGDTDWLHFQTSVRWLLPRLIAGRTRGPLFLADRRPVPARGPAMVDRCQSTDHVDEPCGRKQSGSRQPTALSRPSGHRPLAKTARPVLDEGQTVPQRVCVRSFKAAVTTRQQI
jgi:hypothetical protein